MDPPQANPPGACRQSAAESLLLQGFRPTDLTKDATAKATDMAKEKATEVAKDAVKKDQQ